MQEFRFIRGVPPGPPAQSPFSSERLAPYRDQAVAAAVAQANHYGSPRFVHYYTAGHEFFVTTVAPPNPHELHYAVLPGREPLLARRHDYEIVDAPRYVDPPRPPRPAATTASVATAPSEATTLSARAEATPESTAGPLLERLADRLAGTGRALVGHAIRKASTA